MIRSINDGALDEYLSGPVVDSRLELVSTLDGQVLGELTPRAGSIRWDTTERRGRLDVDAVTDALMNSRHPLANLGQVLEARWVWPELGISVPCGRWLISEPGERTEQIWQVSADPEGPARLARHQWWVPGGQVITGSMAAQLGQMLAEARVEWMPPSIDHSAPATECAPGDSILSSVQKVLDFAEVNLLPDRNGAGVTVTFRQLRTTLTDWSWSDQDPNIRSIKGTFSTDTVPNRVTVWYEEEADGVRTVRGYSEPLYQGPRRWDGPYGRVPRVVKLDAPATVESMRAQCRRELQQAQEHAATVRVVMRADPRIEVGDLARVVSPSDGTDCVGRVTSVELDAGTGLGTVDCSVVTGTVAGVPDTYVNHL